MDVRVLPGAVKNFGRVTAFVVQYADGRADVIVQCGEGYVGLAYRRAKSWVVAPKGVLDCILDSLAGGTPRVSSDVVYYVAGQGLELFYFKGADRVFVVNASGKVVDLGNARSAAETARRLGPGGAAELLGAVGLK